MALYFYFIRDLINGLLCMNKFNLRSIRMYTFKTLKTVLAAGLLAVVSSTSIQAGFCAAGGSMKDPAGPGMWTGLYGGVHAGYGLG